MSSLDNLKARLKFNGGASQEDRMDLDKLRSLKKALLYSYQAQTAILNDNREFKCLINHDKLKEDLFKRHKRRKENARNRNESWRYIYLERNWY